MPHTNTSCTTNKKIFILQSESQVNKKNYSGQEKKNIAALKDRLLAFEPPSTVHNSKIGAGLSSRCEDGLNLGLSSLCGSGEACMSVCVRGGRGGRGLSLSVLSMFAYAAGIS